MRVKYTYVVGDHYWYFRRDGRLERLRGQPGDLDFEADYAEALAASNARIQKREAGKARRAKDARERRAAIRNNASGIVYFIGGTVGPIKIGFTNDLDGRLLRLQMNSPRKLRVLASFEGSRADELELHRQFATSRSHGEWFKRTAELELTIERARLCGTDEAQTVTMLNAQDHCAKAA